MVTISKPISASQAQAYHREQFQNARENYYTENDKIRGEWHGRLADKWGLRGAVDEEQFARLAEGQHPETGEQLVRHQTPREYLNDAGETVKAMEHRAGWDATFSAPKSVSLTALVGHDGRVREAHRESIAFAGMVEIVGHRPPVFIGHLDSHFDRPPRGNIQTIRRSCPREYAGKRRSSLSGSIPRDGVAQVDRAADADRAAECRGGSRLADAAAPGRLSDRSRSLSGRRGPRPAFACFR
jgi:hypothetical protein